MEVIADGLQGFIDWYITEEADIKTNNNIWRLKINGFQQLYEMALILKKGSLSSIKETYAETRPGHIIVSFCACFPTISYCTFSFYIS
jgi:hypothetical protein